METKSYHNWVSSPGSSSAPSQAWHLQTCHRQTTGRGPCMKSVWRPCSFCWFHSSKYQCHSEQSEGSWTWHSAPPVLSMIMDSKCFLISSQVSRQNQRDCGQLLASWGGSNIPRESIWHHLTMFDLQQWFHCKRGSFLWQKSSYLVSSNLQHDVAYFSEIKFCLRLGFWELNQRKLPNLWKYAPILTHNHFPSERLQGYVFHWLVVGPPLWKIWVRQLGWLATQYFWENKIDVPNMIIPNIWENKIDGNQTTKQFIFFPPLDANLENWMPPDGPNPRDHQRHQPCQFQASA